MDGSDANCATTAVERTVHGPLSLSGAQWWCVLKGVNATSQRVNLALISAGVAFFGLMAVIPGVAALVALLGLFGDPTLINGLLDALAGIAPDAVVSIIAAQVQHLISARADALLFGTLFNLALALWSALQGTRVLFELTYPKTSAGGLALEGLSGLEIWEAVQPSPREGKPQPLDPRTFSSTATLRAKIEGADLAAAAFGDHLIVTIPLPEGAIVPSPPTPPPAAAPATPSPAAPPTAAPPATAGTAATPPAATAPAAPRSQTRFYEVRTVGKDGQRSDFSNQVSLIPITPPPAPEQISTTARPDGVLVEWSPVPGALGYAVYRRNALEKSHGQPVHAAGPDEKSWLDTSARFGQSYIYAVTSFNDRNPFVESAITSEREVRYSDRFPPPPPTDLVALAEAGRIRLVWKAVEAEDLAGYVVYRRAPDGDFRRVTAQPLTAAEYADTDVKPGVSYSYRVTAMDQTGNESAPGGEVRAALP